MTLTCRNIKTIILAAVFTFAAAIPVPAQHPALDELKTRLQEGAVFSAGFSQSYYDSYTGETAASTGRVWIGEHAYKVESDGRELVVDGTTSKVYDRQRNRLVISDYSAEDDDFAPSKLINTGEDEYTVTERKSGSHILTVLQTDDEFALFKRVEIKFNSDGIPISITAYDYSENVTSTQFEQGSFFNNNEQWFQLNYPESAEIVDTRY